MQRVDDLSIVIEVLSDSAEKAEAIDVALVGEVRTDVFTGLSQDGLAVSLVETGIVQKGGSAELLVLIQGASEVARLIWQHHEQIDEALQDLRIVYLICDKTVQIARRLFQAHKKRARLPEAEQSSCKVTMTIDGIRVTIEAEDLAQRDAALNLTRKIASLEPQKSRQITAQSQVRVQGKLPGVERRKPSGRKP